MDDQILDIKQMFSIVIEREASDLFIKVGAPPTMKVNGKLEALPMNIVLTKEMVRQIFMEITSEEQRRRFENANEIDTSYSAFGMGRFRVNIFRQQGFTGMVCRYIKSKIPTFEDLLLPLKPMQKLASLTRGMVLVTGVAGSGKSTTIASLLNYVNAHWRKHVITAEDPIEYLFEDNQCLFDQREILIDTASFATALKYSLRQAPDIIMIGEMRDPETVEAAVHAAETGHLVISTVHSVNAFQTVERITNFFPTHQHQLLRQQLSMLLQGVLSQRLIQHRDGKRLVPALEIMLSTPTIKDMLFEGRTRDLHDAIAEGNTYYGTQTFNQSLKYLYQNNMITFEDAIGFSDKPDDLRLELRGITRGNITAT